MLTPTHQSNNARDPWDRVRVLTEQCLQLSIADTPYIPSKVPTFLGSFLARLSNSYHGSEHVFTARAMDTFSIAAKHVLEQELTKDELYNLSLYKNNTSPLGRRNPGFVESTIETARRLRDLRTIEDLLSKRTVGAIAGGSLSYGRFINVKGGADASDIDILLVIESWDQLVPTLLFSEQLGYLTRRISCTRSLAQKICSPGGARMTTSYSQAKCECGQREMIRFFTDSKRRACTTSAYIS